MNDATYGLYLQAVSDHVDAKEDLKNRYNKKKDCCCCCCSNHNIDKRHPKIIEEEQKKAEYQKEIFESIYGGIKQPLNYNQKVFELAKEHKREELKQKMYINEYFIDNVYSKAESAIQDKFIVHKSVFSLAQDIEYFKNTVVDENKLIHQILLEAELNGNLNDFKSEYLKYKRV